MRHFLKMHSKQIWKVTHWLVLLTFTTTSISWGAPIDLSDFQVTKELGSVKERYETKDKNRPSIILVQDAHTSLEAQKNLSGILQEIKKKYQAEIIGVEGAMGDLDYSDLSRFPVKQAKETISEYYLQKGYLSGTEHGAIMSDEGLNLLGLEDEREFKESYTLFLSVQNEGIKLARFVSSYRNFLSQLKAKTYSTKLRELDKSVSLFKSGKLKLFDFIETLVKHSKELPQGALIKTLVDVLNKSKSKPNETLIKQQLSKIDLSKLDSELSGMILKTQLDVAESEIEKEIISLDFYLSQLELLALLKAAPFNTQYFQAQYSKLDFKYLTAFASEKSKRFSIHFQISEDLSLLQQTVLKIKRFYELADDRNGIFVQNLMQRMARARKRSAVIVAGGYHTDGIIQELKKLGVSYAVVTPNISSVKEDGSYLSRMMGGLVPVESIAANYFTALLRSINPNAAKTVNSRIQSQLSLEAVRTGNADLLISQDTTLTPEEARILKKIGDRIKTDSRLRSKLAKSASPQETVEHLLPEVGELARGEALFDRLKLLIHEVVRTQTQKEFKGKTTIAKALGNTVLLDIEEGVATLTLNRPKALNSLTLEMIEELDSHLTAIERNDAVKVVILKGAGDKAFAAGADIKALLADIEAGHPEKADTFYEKEYALDKRLARFSKPIVTFADGFTIGGGLGLAFGSGIIVATERSQFAMPESKIGLFPDVGATYYLPKRVGVPMAKYLAYTGNSINGREAVSFGLADYLSNDLTQIERILKNLAIRDGAVSQAQVKDVIARSTLMRPDTGDEIKAVAEKYFSGRNPEEINAALAANLLSDPDVKQLGATLNSRSPLSIYVADFLIESHANLTDADLDTVFANELKLATLFNRDADYAEGVRAFREKREPNWPSKTKTNRRFQVQGKNGESHRLGIVASMLRSKSGWDMLRALYDINQNKFEVDNARTALGWMGDKGRKPTEGLNNEKFPNVKWLEDGVTNASWEALDRHVATGQGDKVAFIYEGPLTDESGNPLEQKRITYNELLTRVKRFANVLKDLGLKKGDTIVLYMPNTIDIYVAQLAAARLGVIYHPVFAGLSKQQLSDRMHILGAKAILTIDGIFRKGGAVQYLNDNVNPVLDDYLPTEEVIARIQKVLDATVPTSGIRSSILESKVAKEGGRSLRDSLEEKITLEKAKALEIAERYLRHFNLDNTDEILAVLKNELAKEFKRIDHVIIKRELKEKSTAKPRAGELNWDDLESKAEAEIEPVPLSAEDPLFVMFTSGSTGPPKSLVHTVGGYLSMLVRNLRDNFGLTQDDTIFTVADPGWITGQSFVCYAPLTYGMTSVIYNGDPSNIWAAVERYKPSFFKSGVGIYRGAIRSGKETITRHGILQIESLHESGKVFCAYCAEPSDKRSIAFAREAAAGFYDPETDEVITDFEEAQRRLAAGKTLYGNDANMWWRTEEGGPFTSANPLSYPQDPEAKARTLPWTRAAVFVHQTEDPESGENIDLGDQTHRAKPSTDDKESVGGFFIQPQPGMVRGSWPYPKARAAGKTFWDDPVFTKVYYGKSGEAKGWHYTGDGAKVFYDADGNEIFLLLGREDEVLKISGHRIGTIQMEGALRDYRNQVGDVAVIGIPDEVKEQRPVIFAILREGVKPSEELIVGMMSQIENEVGVVAVPNREDIFFVPAFATTKSGKYLRRLYREVAKWNRERTEQALAWIAERKDRIQAKDDRLGDEFSQSFKEIGDVSTLNEFKAVVDTIEAVARARKILKDDTATQVKAVKRTPKQPSTLGPGATVARFTDHIDPVAELPQATEAIAILRAKEDGAPIFADQPGETVTVREALHKIVVPVDPDVEPNQVIAEVLLTGLTHNTLHAVRKDPVDVMDPLDDYHIPGSIAIVRVLRRGSEVEKEGRVEHGKLYLAFPATYDALDPRVGRDPMDANYQIEGYEKSGLHQKIVTLDAYQLLELPADFTLEQAAGINLLDYLTSYKAVVEVLRVRKGSRMLTAGAASGTGDFNNHIASRFGARVTGLVSSDERGEYARERGAEKTLNRKDPRFRDIWTPVPEDPSKWEEWEKQGAAWVDANRSEDGSLQDHAVDFVGRSTFGRFIQALKIGGTLTFYGAFSGYNLTFMGKDVESSPEEMFGKVDMKAGDNVLIYYGTGLKSGETVDANGLAAIKEAQARGARIVVATQNEAQEVYLRGSGIGKIVGIISVESMEKDGKFKMPKQTPDFDSIQDPEKRHRTQVEFDETILKEFGKRVRNLLGSDPDIVVERANQNTLGLSTFIVKKFTGRVVYFENMKGRRYNGYAPTIWMNQRKVFTPGFNIISTHLGNPAQALDLLNRLGTKVLEPAKVEMVQDPDELPAAYERMHHGEKVGTTAVNYGTPDLSVRTDRELDRSFGVKFDNSFGKFITIRYDETPDGIIARVIYKNGAVNSLQHDAINQIRNAFKALNADDRVKVIVLTAEGNEFFMAGQDLKQLYNEMVRKEDAVELALRAQEVFSEIESSPKPVITYLNGTALGGGNELAMSTHYVIASPHIYIGQTEMNLFLLPGFAGTQRLVRLAQSKQGNQGVLKATQAILNGRWVEAREAHELGVIDELVPHDGLVRAYQLARAYLKGEGPLAEVFRRRVALSQSWKNPNPVPESVFEDETIIEILANHQISGREVPARKALGAIRTGLNQGIEPGSQAEAEAFGEMVTTENIGRRGIRLFLERSLPSLPARPMQEISGRALGVEVKKLGELTNELAGKVAFVPGGGSGLGEIITRRLLEAGAEAVVIFSRTEKKLVDMAALLTAEFRERGRDVKVVPIKGDWGNPADVKRAIDETVRQFGRIDILVNDAGSAGGPGSLPNFSIPRILNDDGSTKFDGLKDSFNNLFDGAWITTQAALPHMPAGSSVITISTIFSRVDYYYGRHLYSDVKAALNGLFDRMNGELGARGIRSNIIQPGLLDTAFPPAPGEDPRIVRVIKGFIGRMGLSPEAVADMILSTTILKNPVREGAQKGEWTNQLDIANATVFLASNAAKAFAGQTLEVTNGQLVRTQFERTRLLGKPEIIAEQLKGKNVLIIADKAANVQSLADRLTQEGAMPILALLTPDTHVFDPEKANNIHSVITSDLTSVAQLFESLKAKHGTIDFVISFPQFPISPKNVLVYDSDEKAQFTENQLFPPLLIGREAARLFEATERQMGHGGKLIFVGHDRNVPAGFAPASLIEELIRIHRFEVEFDRERAKRDEKDRGGKTNVHPFDSWQILRDEAGTDRRPEVLDNWLLALLSGGEAPEEVNLLLPEMKASSLGKELGPLTDELKGKVAFVPGGGSGLGEIITRRLLESGAEAVVIMSRTKDKLEKAAAAWTEEFKARGREVKIIPIKGDWGNPAEVQNAVRETVRQFGRIDILVNNAGTAGAVGSLPNIPIKGDGKVEDLYQAYNNLFYGAWILTKAVAPHMPAGSSVITISTSFSRVAYYYGRHGYSNLKAALNGLFDHLNRELGKLGIRSNVIQPGLLTTAFEPPAGEEPRITRVLKGFNARMGLSLEAAAEMILRTAILKNPRSEKAEKAEFPNQLDIANSTVFLAGPQAKAFAGQTLEVTNGQLIRTQFERTRLVGKPEIISENLKGKNVLIIGEDSRSVRSLVDRLEAAGAIPIMALARPDTMVFKPGEQSRQLSVITSSPESVASLFEYLKTNFGTVDAVIAFPQDRLPSKSLLDFTPEEIVAFTHDHLASQIIVGKETARFFEATEEKLGHGGRLILVGPDQNVPSAQSVIDQAEEMVRLRRAEVDFDIERARRNEGGKTNKHPFSAFQIVRNEPGMDRRDETLNSWLLALVSGGESPKEVNLFLPKVRAGRALGDPNMQGVGIERPNGVAEERPDLVDLDIFLNEKDHNGKVAIITGASDGIGRAMALELARKGAKVVLAARRPAELDKVRVEIEEALTQEIDQINRGLNPREREKPRSMLRPTNIRDYLKDRVLVVQTDVSKPEQIKKLIDETVAKHGKIDYLLNNAGGTGPKEYVRYADSGYWHSSHEALVMSAYLLTLMAAPHMAAQGGGYVLNTGTFFAGEPYNAIAYPRRSPYSVFKALMAALARHFIFKLGKDRIRWNTVSPGPVDGGRVRGRLGKDGVWQDGLFTERAKFNIGDKLVNKVLTTILKMKRAEKSTTDIITALKNDTDINTAVVVRAALVLKYRKSNWARVISDSELSEIVREYGQVDRDIFKHDDITKGEQSVERNVMKDLALGTMPPNASIGKAASSYLGVDSQSGEILHPSGGQRMARDAQVTNELGMPSSESLKELSGKTVVITGEHQRDKLTRLANVYARYNAHVHVLVRTPETKEAIEAGIKEGLRNRVRIEIFDVDEKTDEQVEAKLESIGNLRQRLDIVISAPQYDIPQGGLFPYEKGEAISWEKLQVQAENFDRLLWHQVTHHMRLGKIAVNLMTDEERNGAFLIWGPETDKDTSDDARPTVKALQTALKQLTATFAEEEQIERKVGRNNRATLVNQLYLGKSSKDEEAKTPEEQESALRGFVNTTFVLTATTRNVSPETAVTGMIAYPKYFGKSVEERSLDEIINSASALRGMNDNQAAYLEYQAAAEAATIDSNWKALSSISKKLEAIRETVLVQALQLPLADGNPVSDVLGRVTRTGEQARKVSVQIPAEVILNHPFNFLIANETISSSQLLDGTGTEITVVAQNDAEKEAVRQALSITSTSGEVIKFISGQGAELNRIIIQREDGKLTIPVSASAMKNIALLIPILIDLGKREGPFDLASQLNPALFSYLPETGQLSINSEALDKQTSALRIVTQNFEILEGIAAVIPGVKIKDAPQKGSGLSLGLASTLAPAKEIRASMIGLQTARSLVGNTQLKALIIQVSDPGKLSDPKFLELLETLNDQIREKGTALRQIILATESETGIFDPKLQRALGEKTVQIATLTPGASSAQLGSLIKAKARQFKGLEHIGVIAESALFGNRNFSIDEVSQSFLVSSDRVYDSKTKQGRLKRNRILDLTGVVFAVLKKASAYSGRQINDGELVSRGGIHFVQEDYASELSALLKPMLAAFKRELEFALAA